MEITAMLQFNSKFVHIVTCQRIARKGFDKRPALHARKNRTAALCKPFLGNGSVKTFPRRR
jgi:hypothetical protein